MNYIPYLRLNSINSEEHNITFFKFLKMNFLILKHNYFLKLQEIKFASAYKSLTQEKVSTVLTCIKNTMQTLTLTIHPSDLRQTGRGVFPF